MRREVLSYAPDAWYVTDSVKIGYEINFTRHFYKVQPLRTLEEIRVDIVAVRKLITRFEEQKLALIHDAATQGIEAGVRLKPSNIRSLGDIPEHWELRPLKHWVTINSEVLPETTDPDYTFSYIDIGSVGTGKLIENPQLLQFKNAPSRARRVAHIGDTLVSTVRTYLKAIYFVENWAEQNPLICSTGFTVLTPRAGTDPKFISYLFQSNAVTDRIMADSVGIAYPAIPERRLGSLVVAVPTLEEQSEIVSFLDKKTADLDEMTVAVRGEVSRLHECLHEYRTRLVTDMVTGKT